MPLSKFLIVILGLSFILFSTSCSMDDKTTEKNTKTTVESKRPYSPWVFRSVLDSRPRMLTMTLDKNLYVAYSTQHGSLYKAWKGDVIFEGAVYNSAHGPQPITAGAAYFINKHEQPWVIKKNGEEVDFTFQYKGHEYLDADHAILHYDFTVDGKTFRVTEKPDFIESNGQVNFVRSFNTMDVPEGISIVLKSNVSSILDASYFKTDGEMSTISDNKREEDNIKIVELDTEVTLNNNGKTELTAQFTQKGLITNPNDALLSLADLADNEGKTLINKNDCKSCHNTHVKTIGPSYKAIAKRYKSSDADVFYLVNKVINGGAGIWGNVMMTPHPELSKEDATAMVKYILSLDSSDDNDDATSSTIADADYFPPSDMDLNNTIPGGLVKIYDTKADGKMPVFKGLKPTMGGVMPQFGNMDGSDFTGLQDDFGMTIDGYLDIKETQEYTFRMWSDDGSILYIDDKLVVDNDGDHSTSYKENTVGLTKGAHKFHIEFYQGGGGKFLSFNWKPENREAYEVVPSDIITHDPLSHNDISNLTLPMSTVTLIPGNGIALAGSHPSFDITQIRPAGFLPKVGGLDVMKDGRVILTTWDQEGGVYIVDYKNAVDPENITYKRIASGLAEPLGVKMVGDKIYVMQKQEITQLIDKDGDEIIDEYRTITNGWDVSANFHEFGFGLEEKDGFLYATLAIGIMPGGASAKNQPKDRGKVIKVDPNTGAIEFVASGLRTPNGIGIGYNNELYVADNQGDWLPSSKILHITQDAFFNSRAVDFAGTESKDVKAPVVWLPQDEVGNSPSTPSYLNVGPYKNQMIHGEVTHGGLKRVFVEEVEGEYQGALFRFSQGFEAGVNRISWADNENLIVGGIGNPGNWQHTGTKWYGLQKFSYNGHEAFEMLAVRAKTNGVELEFTQAISGGDGWDKDSYEVKQWYYKPTAEYGGPKLDEKELQVVSATVSDDNKKVFLEIKGMKEGHVLHIMLKDHFISDKRQDLWTTECWYSMNQIPSNSLGDVKSAQDLAGLNKLSETQKAAGWKLLFNGTDTEGLRNYNKETIGTSWKVDNGILFLDSKKQDDGSWSSEDGGNVVVTDKPYEDFEFELEWKISNCGNSGIIYNVIESDEYSEPYLTGPEMQILDNTCHPDTKLVKHRAGDLYDLIETKYTTVKPAGEWNKIKIVSKNGTIEHWQNGYKVVEYQNDNDEWKEMIKNSKFADWTGFGTSSKGHIVLQDHTDPVFFRNIKIREL